MIWLWLSAGGMVATALLHSFAGEKRLIGPLLTIHRGILAIDLPRKLFRFAWHAMSVLMLISASVVAWPGTPQPLLIITGGAWLLTGLFDAFYTKGRHIGWPFLAGSGALALIGALA